MTYRLGMVLRYPRRGGGSPMRSMFIRHEGDGFIGMALEGQSSVSGYVTYFHNLERWEIEPWGSREELAEALRGMSTTEIRELWERMTAAKANP